MSPQAKTAAESLLKVYPSDQCIRVLISRQIGPPKDIAESLSLASRWIFAFPHPTLNPAALRSVLRRLPTSGEIAAQVHAHDQGRQVDHPHACIQLGAELLRRNAYLLGKAVLDD